MLILHYKTKKELKESIGKHLDYTETSLFGLEYQSNGICYGTNHPKRSWVAQITTENDLIKEVE